MSWPSTDFEAEIQEEMNNLRALARAVQELIDANDDEKGWDRPRPDIAWARVRKAHAEWVAGDKADI